MSDVRGGFVFMRETRIRSRGTKHKISQRNRQCLDPAGVCFLSITLAVVLGAVVLLSAPGADAGKNGADKVASDSAPIVLDKKFKGNLPITTLTAFEATRNALARLGYRPRAG